MEVAMERTFENFEISFEEFRNATPLTKEEKARKLSSQIDILASTPTGMEHLLQKSLELEASGIFEGTPWSEPDKLVPTLVKGTIQAGHPSSTMEILSELRLLAIVRGLGSSQQMTQKEASVLLEEIVVLNLEFALSDPTESTRESMNEKELKKAQNLFGFLLENLDLQNIYDQLAEEIRLMCTQRPVSTRKVREILHLVHHKADFSGSYSAVEELKYYVNALYGPTPGSKKYGSLEEYDRFLKKANPKKLTTEAENMGHYLRATGIASQYHALLLLHLVNNQPDLVPLCMELNENGEAEWSNDQVFLSTLMKEIVHPDNAQCIYGFACMMERNLFTRRIVHVGLENMRKIKLDPQVRERIEKAVSQKSPQVSALQYLLGATIRILGQPLGVGQGSNPTCQSARGISMWSQHAPAKLMDMIISVATQNNLVIRFEEQELTSDKLQKGLIDKLDYNLDVVSVILVPHLDKIYNEMMRLASGRGEDPHKWVNPAMYGQWIQIGFISAYSYLTNSINDYRNFVRTFYANFHLDYNGGKQIVYPNPIGIYITSFKGEMVGFHAISLLRINKDPHGEMRAYFLNPNNEGRQDWGQDIKPTVSGNGEMHGESSLPFHQLAARVYAFHYNQMELELHARLVPESTIDRVEALAKESWGKSYVWLDQAKLW